MRNFNPVSMLSVGLSQKEKESNDKSINPCAPLLLRQWLNANWFPQRWLANDLEDSPENRAFFHQFGGDFEKRFGQLQKHLDIT